MNLGVVLLRGGLSAFVFDASRGGFGAFAESFGFCDFVDFLLKRGAFSVVDGDGEPLLERLERGGSETSTVRPVGELERLVHVFHTRLTQSVVKNSLASRRNAQNVEFRRGEGSAAGEFDRIGVSLVRDLSFDDRARAREDVAYLRLGVGVRFGVCVGIRVERRVGRGESLRLLGDDAWRRGGE